CASLERDEVMVRRRQRRGADDVFEGTSLPEPSVKRAIVAGGKRHLPLQFRMLEFDEGFRERHIGQSDAADELDWSDLDLGTALLARADDDLRSSLFIATGALHTDLVNTGGESVEVDLPLRRRDPALGDLV